MMELRDIKGVHKKSSAVMKVSAPVMIMSLKEGRCQCELDVGEMPDVVVPFPRSKSSGVNMQRPKANETREDLSYDVYKCLRG
jgi:hypothetical protein